MRKYEKDFLALVKTEMKPLLSIQLKLGMSYPEAEELADYLTKEGLIRSTKMPSEESLAGYIYVVCRPIDKRIWREKYWWVISIISYIAGIVSALISNWINK